MKEVIVLSIENGMSSSDSSVLYFVEIIPEHTIPVVIGEAEANAIILARSGKKTKRPLTHQTMSKVMEVYGIRLERVTVDSFADGIFYSSLHLTDGKRSITVDCRTSDAVALSVRLNAPIFMDEAVIAECGVPLENPYEDETEMERLERWMLRAAEQEDYEGAAVYQEQLEKLKRQQQERQQQEQNKQQE